MHRHKLLAGLAVAGALALAGRAETGQRAQALPAPATDWGSSGEIHAFPVQGSVYLLVGAGGNIAVQIGDDGVLVVDTGLAAHAEKVLAAIRKLSDKTIRYIINTHVHPDHTGGNEIIGKAGSTTQGEPTTVIAHENMLMRMSAPVGKPGAAAPGLWPTDTYFTGEKDIFFNKEPILIYHDNAAHTDGDSMVLFRRSDVIVTGDIFNMRGYPVIDQASGGSVNGILDGLNRVLDLAVPEHEQEGGTYVIPGHGRVCDEADVLEYRDMVTIIKDRIEEMAKRGLTLEQVKAARPTLDYDRHYGADTGAWTTAMFVEAVYRDVSNPAAKPAVSGVKSAPAKRGPVDRKAPGGKK
jgi:glyoxylase-like metal-dependent hydrolase (beta-lactamase superfamily II)